MEISDSLVFTIFITLALSFISLLIYESKGFETLSPKIFNLGLKVFESEESWNFTLSPSDSIFETTSGHFKIVNSTTVLFSYKHPPVSNFKLTTPFPLKGIISLKRNSALIVARAPLSTTLFFFVWLTFLTIAVIATACLAPEKFLTALPIFLLMFAGASAIILYSYHLEKERLMKVFEEFKGMIKN